MICVFGVLRTKAGLKIKNEMLKWLKPLYNVLMIEQDPPGKLFEYPAIKYACKMAIEMNEPILYVHTKGAANPNTWIQKPTRSIWKKEFGEKERAKKLYDIARKADYPLVVCPFSGKGRETWFNGFMINPKAAKILIKNLKEPSKCERHYYERMFVNLKEIRIFCSLNKNCDGIYGVLSYMKYLITKSS